MGKSMEGDKGAWITVLFMSVAVVFCGWGFNSMLYRALDYYWLAKSLAFGTMLFGTVSLLHAIYRIIK